MPKILKNILSFWLILILLGFCELKAQNMEFTQFYAAPLNLNAALTGTGKCQRAIANYRNQWSGLDRGFNAGYTNYMASYDKYVKKYKSGIGFSVLVDNSGGAAPRINQDPNATNSNIATTNAKGIRSARTFYHPTLHYAYKVFLAENFIMQIGMQASYVLSSIRSDNFIFENQIDPLTGYNSSFSNDPSFLAENINNINPFFNFGSGIAFFNDIAFGGVSVKNITQPKLSYLGGTNVPTLYRRITVHGGTIIPLSTHYNKETFIAPEFLFSVQGPLKQLNFGLYWEGKMADHPVYAGMWVRHSLSYLDAFIPYFGIQPNSGDMKVAFSYDVTLGNGFGFINTGGTPELSLIFEFCGKQRPVPVCPRFT